jgi:hypothetical protein
MAKYKTVENVTVEAREIKSFRYHAQTETFYVIFEDGTEAVRPKVHGFIPKPGDMYISEEVITQRPGREPYHEAPKTAIVSRAMFDLWYTLTNELECQTSI